MSDHLGVFGWLRRNYRKAKPHWNGGLSRSEMADLIDDTARLASLVKCTYCAGLLPPSRARRTLASSRRFWMRVTSL